PDGKRLYYLLRAGVGRRTWVSGKLWMTDLESGQRQPLFPDFLMEDYGISPDGARVVFAAIDDNGHGSSPVWIARLDGSPPNRLADVEAGRPLFGPDGDVFFVGLGPGGKPFLYRIGADGSGRRQVLPDPFRVLYDISPDGKWAALWGIGTA